MTAIAISTSTLPNRITQPYAELKRRLEAAGLMRKRPGYYTLMLVTNTLVFGTCLWVLTLVHSVWGTVLAAAVLGFSSGQLGFQLHDSGHRQMFPSRRLNTLVGLVTGNGLLCIASVFAPNHKGMPQIEEGQELDFLRSQVLTSRNVSSNPLTDLFYGSLNFQIEHHLFPTMPRCNVRRANKIVRACYAELGVPYHETSIYRSYREILSFLHEVGASLRQAPA